MKDSKKTLTLDELKSIVNKQQADGSLSKIVGGILSKCHVTSAQ